MLRARLFQIRKEICSSPIHPKADRGESTKKKRRVYVGFMDLEKVHAMVNQEPLCQVLRMYDVIVKLMNRIKSMYVKCLA